MNLKLASLIILVAMLSTVAYSFTAEPLGYTVDTVQATDMPADNAVQKVGNLNKATAFVVAGFNAVDGRVDSTEDQVANFGDGQLSMIG